MKHGWFICLRKLRLCTDGSKPHKVQQGQDGPFLTPTLPHPEILKLLLLLVFLDTKQKFLMLIIERATLCCKITLIALNMFLGVGFPENN
jgi:hypothetical protein